MVLRGLALASTQGDLRPNVFRSFGIACTHFNARLQGAALADCGPATFCLAEGVTVYSTGTRWMWVPGIGIQLPMSSAVALRPHARVLIPQDDTVSRMHAVARIDVGLQWRR
jgi:hypothetical protein